LGGNNSHSSTGGILGGHNTAGQDGYAPAPTLNPHDEERARVVAERAMGSSTIGGGASGLESGIGHHSSTAGSGLTSGQHSGIGSTGGLTSGQHVPGAPGIGHESGHHHGSGVGSGVGLGAGAAAGAGLGSALSSDRHGSALDSERHGSTLGSGLDSERHSSTLGSGLDSERHGSGVGSGVGLGHDSARHGSGVGSGVGLDSTDSTTHGSGDLQHHGSTSGENAHKPPVTSGHKGKLENRDAIPTAGGVKLGEKHWGESDFVPEFPKTEEEKIASAAGQSDSKSTST
jgi:hypothetical protein